MKQAARLKDFNAGRLPPNNRINTSSVRRLP